MKLAYFCPTSFGNCFPYQVYLNIFSAERLLCCFLKVIEQTLDNIASYELFRVSFQL